ncbi:cellulose synthase operon protein YhjQ/BcsQ [Thermogutta sp.]|uniref:cellulose synthase operon protein YhjQ/BcsQ n=1 Tax=Thermogutta sp. TaxID=1962930 RepID=UPI00322044C5
MRDRSTTIRLEEAFLKLGPPGQTSAAPPLEQKLQDQLNDPRAAETASSTPATSVAQNGSPPHVRPALEVDRFAPPPALVHLLQFAAEALEGCLQRIRQSVHSRPRVVGFASCESHQGCTTTVLAVAYELARAGEKVLVIDGSPDHSLANSLGVVAERGWQDAVPSKLSLREVMIRSVEDGFDILPSRPAQTFSPSSATGVRLLPEWQNTYEWILVDYGTAFVSGPVSQRDDSQDIRSLPSRSSVPLSECRDFVVVQRMDSVTSIVRELQKRGRVLGLIETFVPRTAEANRVFCEREAA